MKARFALMMFKGIGSWSADVYLLMVLRRRTLAQVISRWYVCYQAEQLKSRPTPEQLARMAKAWHR